MSLDVLLVEDNDECANLTTFLLTSPPGRYRVTRAPTITDGRRAIESVIFDVMLLDLILPDGDGRELLELAQAIVPRLPVIITSSLDDNNTIEELMKAGADAFVGKDTFTEPQPFQDYIFNAINVRQKERNVIDVVREYENTAAEGVANG